MFGKFSYTWKLMGASWEVLKQDKTLLLFPLFSGLGCLLVLASFALPMVLTHAWQPPSASAPAPAQVSYYGTLFLFYLANYFIITFFNTAIIACAVQRLAGGQPTVADGLREAVARLPLIAGWAVLAATVGLVLRIIEDRSEKAGRFIAGLLGMAWSVISFLAVPVLVIERVGPFAALKSSTALLKKTWGEQLIGNFSFGLAFFVLAIPAVIVVLLGLFSGSAAVVVGCLAVAVIYLVVLSLFQSAMQSIFQAAVYLYTRDGTSPAGFPSELLSQSMQPK